jgi:hypothetical protein
MDAAFGLPMLLVPGPTAALLRVELAEPRVYFDLLGVVLLILAGLYLVASCDAPWSHGAGWVAGAGRATGAAVMAAAAARGEGVVFGAAAVADATLGALHLLAAWLARRAPGGAS